MNNPNEHGKCGKCDKVLHTEAEKHEHAKTCGTKEAAAAPAAAAANTK